MLHWPVRVAVRTWLLWTIQYCLREIEGLPVWIFCVTGRHKKICCFYKTYPNQAVHSEDTPADTDWKIIHVNHNFLMSLRSHFYLKSTRPSLERCLCLIIRKNNDISQNCNAVTMAISLLNSQYFCHKISVNSVLSDMTEVTLGRFFPL